MKNIYSASKERTILDISYGESERTVDIKVFDLANSEKLLNLLQLPYLDDLTYEKRSLLFLNYLLLFIKLSSHDYEKSEEYLKTNPYIRIIFLCEKLRENFDKVISERHELKGMKDRSLHDGNTYTFDNYYHLDYEVNEDTGKINRNKLVPFYSSDQVSINLKNLKMVKNDNE